MLSNVTRIHVSYVLLYISDYRASRGRTPSGPRGADGWEGPPRRGGRAVTWGVALSSRMASRGAPAANEGSDGSFQSGSGSFSFQRRSFSFKSRSSVLGQSMGGSGPPASEAVLEPSAVSRDALASLGLKVASCCTVWFGCSIAIIVSLRRSSLPPAHAQRAVAPRRSI